MTNAQRSRGWAAITVAAILVMLGASVATAQVQASIVTFKTLANFGVGDGENPNGFLAQATDGNFYSTAYGGGTNRRGVVFKMTSGGAVTTLYNFCCSPDGWHPDSGLIQGIDGSLYSTTIGGGVAGGGTAYKITSAGTLTTLYSFCSVIHCADGTGPYGPLVQGFNGDFYGTTWAGGAKGYCPVSRCGTVFQVTSQGTLTTLYSFCAQPNCADGASLNSGVVQGTDGDFYGTTISGGAGAFCLFGTGACGTVFKVTPQGSLTTLYNFCSQPNCTDGFYPGQLIQAEDGNFYGTTSNDGFDHGTIFRITPQGVLTTLYTFCALQNCTDGDVPSGLIQASDGNFYGTTAFGGASTCSYSGYPGCGTLFELTSTGRLTTLYSFCPQGGKVCLDGEEPGGLVQRTDGSFYGETYGGGAAGFGTAFNLATGLKAFVETQTTAGSVGSSVVILGTKLTGATGVTFNSVAAEFTVVSSTEIAATVPSGAATGPVYVSTASGTLKSNKNFHVAP